MKKLLYLLPLLAAIACTPKVENVEVVSADSLAVDSPKVAVDSVAVDSVK